MIAMQVTVVKPGLETSVQELPGRVGYLEQGFPLSGPLDCWSFRLANLLVGNPRDTAALECQFLGPALRFGSDGMVAVTGADMHPTLDGSVVPMWQSLPVRAGQVLELGPARTGARSYIALAGGIDTPPVLGSRAVFHMAGVGGRALKSGETIPVGPIAGLPPVRVVNADARPVLSDSKSWHIEVIAGPNDDWLSKEAIATFLSADWILQSKSSRTGMRLTGPQFTFSERALNKNPDHGQDPSNIIDHGYPLGAVNLAGQTPIILTHDSPSTGGFINPFTVASAALWKLGQARPGEVLRFRSIDLDEAADLRQALDQAADLRNLRPV